MNNISGFQRDLLHVIAGCEKLSGRDIRDEAEKYYDGEINHGRLYQNLDTLVDKGLIDKEQMNDRRANGYYINEQGREIIKERVDWESKHINYSTQIR